MTHHLGGFSVPLYLVECSNNHKEEVYLKVAVEGNKDLPRCSKCNNKTVKLIAGFRAGDFFPHGGLTLDHAEENPIHFDTKKQLQKYCKDKGISSGALL